MGYFWTQKMDRWVAFGREWTTEEETTFGHQVAPSTILLDTYNLYFFGGVTEAAKLSETGKTMS